MSYLCRVLRLHGRCRGCSCSCHEGSAEPVDAPVAYTGAALGSAELSVRHWDNGAMSERADKLGWTQQRFVYFDGESKRYKVAVQFIAHETFASQEDVEAWMSEHFDGLSGAVATGNRPR